MKNSELNRILSARITAIRKEHNLNMEQLAYRSEISKGGLSELERNMKEPRIFTILKICAGLNITLKDFFDFQEIDEYTNKF